MRVGHRFALVGRDQDAVAAAGDLAAVRRVGVKQAVHHRGAARVGQQLAMIADQAARRRIEDQPHAAAAGGTHLDQLALALGSFCTTTPACSSSTSIDHLLDRLEQLAGRLVAATAPSAATRKARSLRGAWSRSGCRAAIRRGRRPPSNPSRRFANAQRDVALGLAQQPLADHAALHLVALGAGERRIVDAEGHRQGRRIDRLRRERLGRPRARTACATTVASGRPAMATMSPAKASSIGVRSRPRKASTLVTRPCSIELAVAVEHLDRLVRLDRARGDAAGDDAAEIGIGLEDGAEHAERPVLDRRRRRRGARPGRTAASCPRPSGRRARPPSSPAWPSRRGSGNRAAPRWRRARRTGRRPR